MGDGTEPGREADGKIEIPMACCCQGYTEEDLIQEVYGDLDGMTLEERHERFTRCAILAPTNKEVDALNDFATEKYKLPDEQGVPSPEDIFYSADSVRDCCNPALYPTEFLNSLEFGAWCATPCPSSQTGISCHSNEKYGRWIGQWYSNDS